MYTVNTCWMTVTTRCSLRQNLLPRNLSSAESCWQTDLELQQPGPAWGHNQGEGAIQRGGREEMSGERKNKAEDLSYRANLVTLPGLPPFFVLQFTFGYDTVKWKSGEREGLGTLMWMMSGGCEEDVGWVQEGFTFNRLHHRILRRLPCML